MRDRPGGRATPPRALVLSLICLAAAAGAGFLRIGESAEALGFLWMLALIPAFLLSYHRGWRGAARALERDEFFLHYQPIVRLSDGDLAGVEALVRWRHPERGLLHPDQFIAEAERTGRIVPLGRWVVERACADRRRWTPETVPGPDDPPRPPSGPTGPPPPADGSRPRARPRLGGQAPALHPPQLPTSRTTFQNAFRRHQTVTCRKPNGSSIA